jgi:hypothetical protein
MWNHVATMREEFGKRNLKFVSVSSAAGGADQRGNGSSSKKSDRILVRGEYLRFCHTTDFRSRTAAHRPGAPEQRSSPKVRVGFFLLLDCC